MEKEKKNFKVPLDIVTMQAIIDLVEYSGQHFPFTQPELWTAVKSFRKVIQDGCFIHNIFRVTVKTGLNETLSFCPKCSPKDAKKYEKMRKFDELYY